MAYVYDHTLLNGRHSVFMDGWKKKRTRGSTALKQCLTENLILFLNLRAILPIQGNLRYTGHLIGQILEEIGT